MDTQCFGTGDSHVEAFIQIILFWYRFVDFSLYKYWKIVSCLWLYRGQCCWCIGWNRPKIGFVIHFAFLWLGAILSCWFFRTCPWKLVFLDGEKNTCHPVEGQATETWNISISWCLPPGVPPSPWPPRRPHVRCPPSGCHACACLYSLHRPHDWLWWPHAHQSSFTFMLLNVLAPSNIILLDQGPFCRRGVVANND